MIHLSVQGEDDLVFQTRASPVLQVVDLQLGTECLRNNARQAGRWLRTPTTKGEQPPEGFTISAEEEGEIRQIASQLGIELKEYLAARLKYSDKRSVFRHDGD